MGMVPLVLSMVREWNQDSSSRTVTVHSQLSMGNQCQVPDLTMLLCVCYVMPGTVSAYGISSI